MALAQYFFARSTNDVVQKQLHTVRSGVGGVGINSGTLVNASVAFPDPNLVWLLEQEMLSITSPDRAWRIWTTRKGCASLNTCRRATMRAFRQSARHMRMSPVATAIPAHKPLEIPS